MPTVDPKKVSEQGKIVAMAAKRYERGEITANKFNSMVKAAQHVPGFMDFYDVNLMADEREEQYKSYIDSLDLGKFYSNWWRTIKKEAGIRSARLFSSDAKVGKHIDNFNKSVSNWFKTGGGRGRIGDVSKLRATIKAAEELKHAFAEFLHKKEFATDLAQQLQGKIRDLSAKLDQLLAHENSLLNAYLDQSKKKKEMLLKTLKSAGLPV
jgi:heme-degrading monooxygenase HmoA